MKGTNRPAKNPVGQFSRRKGGGNLTERSKGMWIFWTSLCVTMVILGGLLLGFLLLVKAAEPADTPQDDVPYFTEENKPGRRENLTAVVFGCREAESLPELVEVLYYDAPNSELTFFLLPPETVCTLDGRTDTIQGHYDYEGMSGGMKAVGALLGADIDRYLRIQKKGVGNMVDYFGGMNYEVSENITIDGQRILAGEQLLDGRRFSAFFFQTDEYGAVDPVLQAEFTGKLLRSGLDRDLAKDYPGLASAVFYNCETNLNQYDFAIRQQGFTGSIGMGKLQVKTVVLDGAYNEDHSRFAPSEQSLQSLSALLQGRGAAESE